MLLWSAEESKKSKSCLPLFGEPKTLPGATCVFDAQGTALFEDFAELTLKAHGSFDERQPYNQVRRGDGKYEVVGGGMAAWRVPEGDFLIVEILFDKACSGQLVLAIYSRSGYEDRPSQVVHMP
jgi:hypothetical protein